jgi:UDP-glucuronate decarboxylase
MTGAWFPTSSSDGEQTRSFCYVDDLIDAFIAYMDKDGDIPGPINLGNPGEFTIRRLAETVIDLTGSKSKLVFQPLPSDDPKQRQPDIEKAKALLGWAPKVPLDEGLKRTIAYFDALLKEGDPLIVGR